MIRIIYLFICSILIIIFLCYNHVLAQFPPPAGQPGSTAIFKDSSAIIGWATDCQVFRGYVNMADTSATYNGNNRTTYGSYLYASGPSDEYVVSLGDHGSAVLGFDPPIKNGSGADFAVFENSFGDLFLELAFVEVSSDGIHFVRFPSITYIGENEQIPTFGTMEAIKFNNFAGKYRMGYGTPFDLSDLKDSTGIDLNHITQVRIVDVGGCITEPFVSRDSQGHKVNDPWPTPFDTGGFDLDAIGVIHNTLEGTEDEEDVTHVKIFPNPFIDQFTIIPGKNQNLEIQLTTLSGIQILQDHVIGKKSFSISEFPQGIYLLKVVNDHGFSSYRKLVRN